MMLRWGKESKDTTKWENKIKSFLRLPSAELHLTFKAMEAASHWECLLQHLMPRRINSRKKIAVAWLGACLSSEKCSRLLANSRALFITNFRRELFPASRARHIDGSRFYRAVNSFNIHNKSSWSWACSALARLIASRKGSQTQETKGKQIIFFAAAFIQS